MYCLKLVAFLFSCIAALNTAFATDIDILNFALTLEHLEAAFYNAGLMKFTESDFLQANFSPALYKNLLLTRRDENVHVQFLADVINTAQPGAAVPACTYNFPLTDVVTFVTISSALENTGVKAYDGAISSIQNPAYQTAGAAIATVEARHAAYFNVAIGKASESGPFDTPLGMRAIISIAAQFIQSCPFTLPVAVLPAVTVGSTTVNPGSTITFPTVMNNMNCIFVYGLFQSFAQITVSGGSSSCIFPSSSVNYTEVVLFVSTSTTYDSMTENVMGPVLLTVAPVDTTIYCPKFINSNNFVSFPQTLAGQVAQGTCQPRSSSTGTPSIQCKADGTYGTTITNPCIPIMCPQIMVAHATYPETRFGKMANGTCDDGYSGMTMRKCNTNGQWGAFTGYCERLMCMAEEYMGVSWPATNAGASARGPCTNGMMMIRMCDLDGTFETTVSSKSC